MRKMKGFVFFLIIAFAAYLFWMAQTGRPREERPEPPSPSARPSSQPREYPSASPAPEPAGNSNADPYLILVNGEHPLLSDPDGASIVPVWPGVSVLTTDITLNETAREAVRLMFEAAEEEQAGSFYVSSGYRGYDEQTQTYEETEDKSLVQPPGRSEHQTGLAADIMAEGVGQFDLADSNEGKWLAENAWRFGLILRYADHKEDITGIAGEAWHFRYVGEPHARYCYENDLCLEEYTQYLQDTD